VPLGAVLALSGCGEVSLGGILIIGVHVPLACPGKPSSRGETGSAAPIA